MRYVKFALFAYAILCVIGGIILFQQLKGSGRLFLAGYLFINATVIIGAVVFEKYRYHPKIISKEGWQPTGERFTDPSTKKLMEVYYNPKTGERDYTEVNSKKQDNGV